MFKFFKFFIFLFCFNFFFNNTLKAESNYDNKLAYKNHEHVSLELISPVNSIGQENNLNFGLFFKLKPGWKIYWKNPGKAGYPPTINWVKSKNIEKIKILWPKPKKFEILGMESTGYSGDIVLPIDLQIKNLSKSLFINFAVDYLICNKICIPIIDELILKLPAGDGETSKNAELIKTYLKKVEQSSSIKNLRFNKILTFFIIAFIGGIILNLMPCVFPVLSLKIYNVLLQLNNSSNKNIRKNLYATVFGILFSFFLIALLTILLKKFGHTVGWGFQFQSPLFLSFIIVILILFSLNLANFFNFDIPVILKKYLNKILNLNKNKSELFQNFLLGFFLTILSTPCSAPFIGTAIGFAFISPNHIIFLIFFSISLGLASPYIVLATYPQILSILPKPGEWMQKLKYFLSFLLFLTALWLISILLIQINNKAYSDGKSKSEWIDFNINKVNKLVDVEKSIVFVDITADWCITCFFNKKTVLDRKKIIEVFKENDVKKMRGDLTKPNKIITEYINSFGRFGIPVNVIYSPSAPQGILFSEILTVKDLLSTLEKVKND